MSSIRFLFAVGGAGLAACACFITANASSMGSPRVDVAAVERSMGRGIERQLGVSVHVTCPEAKRLARMTCTVRHGDSAKLRVDARPGSRVGRLAWSADIMATAHIERSIRLEVLRRRGIAIDVDCPDLVALDTHGFACEAADSSGRTSTVDVRLDGADGSATWSVA